MTKSCTAERGFLTFAIGGDYIEHARAQALSIKISQHHIKNFAVVIDNGSAASLRGDDQFLFDKVIEIDHKPDDWDMSKEWMAFSLSPWRETIKTDADMIFTSDIYHWWNVLRQRDVVLTTQVRDFRGDLITSRKHRKLFDINHLPNVYSALTYFRYSKLAADFYNTIMLITRDWEWVARDLLIKNDDPRPRTDEIYALAARQLGSENLTLPITAMPTFVHMKEQLNGLSIATPWFDQIDSYYTGQKLFVGNVAQTLPFHYHQKGWIKNGRLDRAWGHNQKFHRSHGCISQRSEHS